MKLRHNENNTFYSISMQYFQEMTSFTHTTELQYNIHKH